MPRLFAILLLLLGSVVSGEQNLVDSPKVLNGNVGQVEGVSFSHNGKWIASCDNSGGVAVHSMKDFSLSALLRARNFSEVTWTHDDRMLVAGGFDSLVYLWKWQTDNVADTLHYPGQVEAIAVSSSGIVLAAGGGDRTIWRWMLPSKKELFPLAGHTDDIYTVKLSPDGKLVVSAGRDRTIRVWDSSTGSSLRVLTGHEDSVYDLTFSQDGKFLISGCRDGTVGVWSTLSWKMEQLLRGPDNSIHGVAVSPKGSWIAGAGFDRNVWLWLLDSSNKGRPLSGHRRKVSGVAFSPDGQWLASAASDTTVLLWQFR